ncbi:XrtA/PEP-CTERM system TPR-repeat protein PrsT [Halochromatium glycolicum]|uniref:PEP-CTERM system TPR-repeat protein PrsT n=1 Tax=Halochromatium glycolicum TaxID=85075 RepID=A0AAJ0U1T4_9GAMM|nr:XrtA/PEP-CTERM system TPR-repeat protein PrsT [Halochromatium glycolicum]MBK1703622.1 hypothetical protein [Halochromatium glycolicum]
MHRSNHILSQSYRRTIQVALPLSAALLITACGETSVSAEDHVAQAQEAYANGDVRTAIIEIKNALQQAPQDAENRLLLGRYNLELGKAVEAEAELIRAKELGADPAALRLPLLRSRLMQGKHDEVIDSTEAVGEFEEAQQPGVLTLRAQALLSEGRIDEARAALDRALALEPTAPEALLSKAWVEWLDKDEEAARTQLRAALDADPELDRAWELLGDVERDTGNLEEAESAYSKAIEHTSISFSPRFKRALTHIFQQDYASAEKDLEALRKQAGENPAVSYVSGLIAFYQQRYDGARADFEETLARKPDYMPAVFYLGATQYALENWGQAQSYLSRYTRRFPSSPEANRLLALSRLRDGDSERAEQTLGAILKADPEDRTTLAMMSNLYLAQGRADEALHHLRKVIAMEPDSAATRAKLGIALLQEGQREEGFSELDRAIELAPGETQRLEIAIVLERLRAAEYQQALERLERLHEREALSPGLYYNLKAIAHVGLNEIETAKAIFNEGLEKVPAEQRPDLANNLARLQLRDGNSQEAQELLSDSLSETPEHLPSLMSFARLKAQANDLEEAQALLERAVAAHPDAQQPRLALAQLHLRADRPTDALELLRETDQQGPERSTGWLALMATALVNAGNPTEAIDILRELHEQRPDAANVSLMLSRLLIERGDRAEARNLLEQAMKRDAENLGLRLTLVELLTLEAELDEAAERLAPAAEAHPDDPRVLARAGAIEFAAGRYAEAIDAFQRARRLAPADRYVAGALAKAQHVADDTEAAVATLSDWLQQFPDDPGMRLLQANLLVALNRDGETIAAYRRYLDSGQENAVALNNLAWLLRTSDTDEALRLVERAAELAPESAEILDTKGVIEQERENYTAAIETFRRALSLSPGNPSIRLHLAEALIADGQGQSAKEQLSQLLAEDPGADDREKAETLLNGL